MPLNWNIVNIEFRFNIVTGTGVITPDLPGPDVTVHVSDLDLVQSLVLEVGQAVEYVNVDGEAKHVRPLLVRASNNDDNDNNDQNDQNNN